MTETFVTELNTPEARVALAEASLALFEQWGIHELNQLELLGIQERKDLQPGVPLPHDKEVLERAGQLLAIGRTLHKLFPYHPSRRNTWVLTANPGLNDHPPINVMLEGLDGIRKVRELLEDLARTIQE